VCVCVCVFGGGRAVETGGGGVDMQHDGVQRMSPPLYVLHGWCVQSRVYVCLSQGN
jgi:hypothetical protein